VTKARINLHRELSFSEFAAENEPRFSFRDGHFRILCSVSKHSVIRERPGANAYYARYFISNDMHRWPFTHRTDTLKRITRL
jgi:hypothetical protein